MRRIRNKDTKPELVVRRLVHSRGYRYRLHGKNLPGCPDLVFSRRKKVIFIHGCFWHQHEGCKVARLPKSKLDYWVPKLERNKQRDAEALAQLKDLGWDVLTIWECQTKDLEGLAEQTSSFLDEPRASSMDYLEHVRRVVTGLSEEVRKQPWFRPAPPDAKRVASFAVDAPEAHQALAVESHEGCDPQTGSDTSFHRDELGTYVDGPEDLTWYDQLQAELQAEAARKSKSNVG